MKPHEINIAIFNYLEANWTYTSIREVAKDQKPDLPYIESYFLPGGVFGLEIMGAAERVGVFKINIFTALGAGTIQGEAYAGEIEELFFHKNIGGVWCENGDIMPYTQYIGVDNELQANHHQVTIPFSIIYQ